MRMIRGLVPVVLALAACGDSGGAGTSGGSSSSGTDEPATSFVTGTGEATDPDPTTTPTTGATTTTGATDTGTTESATTTTTDPGDTSTTDATGTTGTTSGVTTGTSDTASDTDTGGEAVCGDGVVEGDEGCDEGPDNGPNAACHDDCQPDVCGDGLVGPTETCDDGNDDPSDSCSNTCKPDECGDGFESPNEICDDSDLDNDDGCTMWCTLPACGDGLVQPNSNNEDCDEGMDNDDSAACTTACLLAACGDGLVWAGEEQCDDGNAIDLDACSNACVAATCTDKLQNAGELGVDCGGPNCAACPVLLMLGGNASKLVGASFDGKAWSTADIAAPSVDPPALAVTSDGVGVGVFRYTKLNDPKDRQLQFVRFTQGWSAPAQIGSNTTRAAPAISANDEGAHVVFHGENFQYYYAAHDGMAWNPSAEMVGSFGPGPGGVATLAGGPVLVFHDGAQNNDLHSRVRMPPWQPQQLIDTTSSFDDMPRVVALTSGAELLTVYVRNNDDQVRFATRKAGTWTAGANLPGAIAPHAPALAALPGGKAVVAFRGTDNKLYTSTYDAAGNAWTAVTAVAANPISAGAPAVAPGVGAADVELVYLDAVSKAPRHVRRVGGVWTAALVVSATGLDNVALASRP